MPLRAFMGVSTATIDLTLLNYKYLQFKGT